VLEAPGSDEAPEFASLYRARGNEVARHRPIFTGDVFSGVAVEGRSETAKVIVLQHPCVIRRGVDLTPRLLVAEVVPAPAIAPSKWSAGHYRQLPLAELDPTGSPKDFAALLDQYHLVKPDDLLLHLRLATLSQQGVNLMMQRWVHHNSRVIVPTHEYHKTTSAQFEEADLIEDWCMNREDDGVELTVANGEIDAWLTGNHGVTAPRKRLEDPQQRSAVRREVRDHLSKVRSAK
jgi:hypothetical protein